MAECRHLYNTEGGRRVGGWTEIMQGRSMWCLINVAKGSNLHGCDMIDNGLHIREHECELCWGYRQRTKATSIVDLRPSSSVTFSIKSSLTPSALTALSLQWAYILLLPLLHNLTFNHFFIICSFFQHFCICNAVGLHDHTLLFK